MARTTMEKFINTIWSYHRIHRRDFPWRDLDWKSAKDSAADAADITYRVVVSEIMLQQTQAARVVPRYERFLKTFPDWKSLARASNSEILREWQGLGYNRRALYLKRIAETIIKNGNALPDTYDALRELPGIGPNTAGSVLAFAFNIPHPFIETNIRSVFIYFFFKKSANKINDRAILALIEKSLADPKNSRARKNPREWYYALMDYGAMLKSSGHNPSRRSIHHATQSSFKGSNREVRAELIRNLLKKTNQGIDELVVRTIAKHNPHRTKANILKNLKALEREGFIDETNSRYSIRK